jgi:hypothetical protein
MLAGSVNTNLFSVLTAHGPGTRESPRVLSDAASEMAERQIRLCVSTAITSRKLPAVLTSNHAAILVFVCTIGPPPCGA